MNFSEQILTWLERHNVSAVTVGTTFVLLIIASIVILLINRLLRRWLRAIETRVSLPYETISTLTRVVSGFLWLMTALILLDIWGIGIGGIWTLLVSAATVVGVGFLATWAMVSNITASFFVSVWRPFRVGDTVHVLPENLKGQVVDRNMMFTTLREDDGSVIQVPNNLFFQKMFRVVDSNQRYLFEELARTPRNTRDVGNVSQP